MQIMEIFVRILILLRDKITGIGKEAKRKSVKVFIANGV
jgi:hypothetical protein